MTDYDDLINYFTDHQEDRTNIVDHLKDIDI